MKAISDGNYDEGVEHLERAYDILPHPNVLYNIGLAHMYAGRLQAAVELFRRYQETAPANDAVEVDMLIRSLEAKSAAPPSAEAVAAAAANPGGAEQPGDAETLAIVDGAAREVRQLAEQQDSDVLRNQAEQLEAVANKLRAGQQRPEGQAVPVEAHPEQTAKASEPPRPAQAVLPAGQSGAREAVYEEQVVSASRFGQSPLDAPNATATITGQDIRMSGLIQLSPLLRRVAGVEVTTVTPNHAEIGIRGLNRRLANKVLLLWDGRQIRKDFLGTIWMDLVPILPDDIERIEVIRGPASALYGADAFSGVINIITRPAGKGGSYAVTRIGNHGQYEGGVSISSRTGDVSYRASAGYKQVNNAVRAVSSNRVDVQSYGAVPDLAVENMMANADVSYAYAKNGVLSVGGNYEAHEFTLQGESLLGQTVTRNAYVAQAYGSLTTPVGFRFSTNYDLVVGHPGASYFVPGSVGDAIPADTRQDLLDLDLAWSGKVRLLAPQALTFGTSYRYKHIAWDWTDAVHTQNHIGGYFQDVIQLAPPLKLQLGARVDRHPLLAKPQFSPRGSLVYRFFGEQSFRLSGARAFRGPSFLESYLQLQVDSPLRAVSVMAKGNPHLKPESITSVELGYQNQESDYFSLEVNVYYNWIRNLIFLTDLYRFKLRDYAGSDPLVGYQDSLAAFPVAVDNFDNERAVYRQIGGELGARVYPTDGLDLYVNYSIHDTSPTDKSKVDEGRAKEQQTSLHKVNAGLQYRAWFGLETSVDMSWVSTQLWVEQVADVDSVVRWKDYHQPSFLMLNARLGYRLFSDRVELGVSGTNLAFQHQRQHPWGQPMDTRVLGTTKVRF